MRLVRDIVVYPSIDAQAGFEELLISLQGEIASFYRGQGNDFYRIRPYEVLESAHHVDWKATAHTGDLQVREFAREREQAVAFFLDLDIPGSQSAWSKQRWTAALFWPGISPSAVRESGFVRRMWTGSSPKRPTFIPS